jgi:hypothetical protein
MSAHPETRFRCDRCGVEVNAPVANTPLPTRFAPPEGWTTFKLGEDGPPQHLCAQCLARFRSFWDDATSSPTDLKHQGGS